VVEQTPLGRLAEVSDIGDAAVFLCSNDARFITGRHGHVATRSTTIIAEDHQGRGLTL
jgi:enoyl-[acyl-carrier-protein] reductase (NADH)